MEEKLFLFVYLEVPRYVLLIGITRYKLFV